jgi:hypothetical protein
MELFIRLIDGHPYEHPIYAENLLQAFPHVDINNLTSEFARFERVAPPTAGMYEVVEGPTYQWVDGVVKDVWTTREMTVAERSAKNEQMVQGAYELRDFFKTLALQGINDVESDEVRHALRDYVAVLDSYVVVDPANPMVPLPPRVGDDGAVLTTTAPGAAPYVTG